MASDFSGTPELGAVVVGIDASPQARTAVLWAAAEADRRGRPLHIVHATDTGRRTILSSADTIQALRETARDLLARTADAVRARFPGLSVTKELSRQEPVAGLYAAAGDRATIVVGSRGLGGFGALMLGSVGLGVAARAKVPVIVVRGEPDRAETGVITAAVKGPSDLDWLMTAAAEAQVRKATLRLLSVCNVLAHVGSVTTMLDDIGGIAEQRVREVSVMADRVRARCPGLTLTHHVETGTSVPGVLVEVTAHTDLLVMGSRHRVFRAGPALGRVSHALLHHGHCPVEIVPPEFAMAGDEP
ncbi:universal stress protein [Streptomyces laculatispora]|uniref:Universal stress protein n=1 Tax=Streptomyces laculatispora TaxID=887464 RepID=A0ABY9HYA8_9ACTN|nr:universal stress protein [Streptomyces laculatispora]WLQ39578.1 universal stress protein [Streptomyces laculatispora]